VAFRHSVATPQLKGINVDDEDSDQDVLARPVWRRRFDADRFGARPFWRRTFWRYGVDTIISLRKLGGDNNFRETEGKCTATAKIGGNSKFVVDD